MVGGTLQPESLVKYADANGVIHNALVLAVTQNATDPDVEHTLGNQVGATINLVYAPGGVSTTVNNVKHVSLITPQVIPPVSCWFYA